MAMYPSLYRAKAVNVVRQNGSPVMTAYVPQVFGDTPIKITDFHGAPEPGMGWVFFQSGSPEYPVWSSAVAASTDGGNGEAHNHDAVYVNVAGDTMTGNLTAPEPTVNSHVATKAYVDQQVLVTPGPPGQPGVGIPTGGATGTFLSKTGPADYQTGWVSSSTTFDPEAVLDVIGNALLAGYSGGTNDAEIVVDYDDAANIVHLNIDPDAYNRLTQAHAHISNPAGAHLASAISFVPTGLVSSGTVQAAISEVAVEAESALASHANDTTDIHGIVNTATLYRQGITIPISDGGTGATTAPQALSNLGGISSATADLLYVNITGDAMSGPLLLPSADPTQDNHAARKQYVDSQIGSRLTQAQADVRYVNIDGDTMTGLLTANLGVTISGDDLDFGSRTAQLISFYGAGQYAEGVQSGTLFWRTGDHFAWYRGGAYSSTRGDAGVGGTKWMHLESAGLNVAVPFTVAGSVASTLTGTLSVGGAATIGGNLTVNGTTLIVNSTTVTFDDPMIGVAGDTAPTSDDGKDRGISFRWYDGATAQTGFFGFDTSSRKFTFIPIAGITNDVVTTGTKGTLDANLAWADILNRPNRKVTVNLTGPVTGTANGTMLNLDNDITLDIAGTLGANTIALTTHTTGNYVASVSGHNPNRISISGAAGEGTAHVFDLPQDIHAAATPSFVRMTLTAPQGTIPLTLTSRTMIPNLNADLLDGLEGNYFADKATVEALLGDLWFQQTYDAESWNPANDLPTRPRPISLGPNSYRNGMYWIVKGSDEVGFISQTIAGVTVMGYVKITQGDWLVAVAPQGHPKNTDIPEASVIWQYLPYSTETYITGLMDEHVNALDPHASAGYITHEEGDAWWSKLGHTHADFTSLLNAHVAAADPHPVYLNQDEGDSRYSLGTHDHKSLYLDKETFNDHVTGLDPHPQYLNNDEGISFFALKTHPHVDLAPIDHTHPQYQYVVGTDVSVGAPSHVFVGAVQPPAGSQTSPEPQIGDIWIETFTLDLRPPPPPISFTASSPSGTQVSLTWTEWTTPIASIEIQRSLDPVTTWTPVHNVLSMPTEGWPTTWVDTGVLENTGYTYRIRAKNAASQPADETWATAKVKTTNDPPTPPRNVASSNLQSTSFTITWQAPTIADLEDSDAYQPVLNNVAVPNVNTWLAPNVLTYNFTGLSENTEYTATVRAKDMGQLISAPAPTVTVTTPNAPPPIPTGLVPMFTHTSVGLSWTAVTGINDFLRYDVTLRLAGLTVTNRVLVSNVATLTTSAAHAMSIGQQILVTGVGAPFDGIFTITTVPTTTTFTYACTSANIGSGAVAGTAAMTASTTGTSHLFNNLTMTTAYTVGVRTVDTYQAASSLVTANVTTSTDPDPIAPAEATVTSWMPETTYANMVLRFTTPPDADFTQYQVEEAFSPTPTSWAVIRAWTTSTPNTVVPPYIVGSRSTKAGQGLLIRISVKDAAGNIKVGTPVTYSLAPETVTVPATSGGTWRGTWRNDSTCALNDVIQGRTTSGENRGCFFYGNALRDALAGKTFVPAGSFIEYHRRVGEGAATGIQPQLWVHNLTERSGPPSFSNGGATQLGSAVAESGTTSGTVALPAAMATLLATTNYGVGFYRSTPTTDPNNAASYYMEFGTPGAVGGSPSRTNGLVTIKTLG